VRPRTLTVVLDRCSLKRGLELLLPTRWDLVGAEAGACGGGGGYRLIGHEVGACVGGGVMLSSIYQEFAGSVESVGGPDRGPHAMAKDEADVRVLTDVEADPGVQAPGD
jgi:hypothetical protein